MGDHFILADSNVPQKRKQNLKNTLKKKIGLLILLMTIGAISGLMIAWQKDAVYEGSAQIEVGRYVSVDGKGMMLDNSRILAERIMEEELPTGENRVLFVGAKVNEKDTGTISVSVSGKSVKDVESSLNRIANRTIQRHSEKYKHLIEYRQKYWDALDHEMSVNGQLGSGSDADTLKYAVANGSYPTQVTVAKAVTDKNDKILIKYAMVGMVGSVFLWSLLIFMILTLHERKDELNA